MNNEFIELFRYNAWANHKFRETLRTISFNDLEIETPYGLLLDRIVHIFASFEMWYKRMNGESPQSVLTGSDFVNWEELEKKWIEFDNLLLNFVQSLDIEDLDKSVTYWSLDKTQYTRKIKHILFHLTQHPTYHRGQVSAIFKERNMVRLPSTDVVIFYQDPKREKFL
ncbi:MAG: DinB family protein [Candidatus Kariarchaeaceae archaeon]|jgi:uncharacterized damage-inducible protein DinB